MLNEMMTKNRCQPTNPLIQSIFLSFSFVCGLICFSLFVYDCDHKFNIVCEPLIYLIVYKKGNAIISKEKSSFQMFDYSNLTNFRSICGIVFVLLCKSTSFRETENKRGHGQNIHQDQLSRIKTIEITKNYVNRCCTES